MRRTTPLLVAGALALTGGAVASATITQKPKPGELRVVALAGAAGGQTLQVIDSGQPTKAPGRARVITGLEAGDALVGIDFRPATGELIGLARNGTTLKTYGINYLTAGAVKKADLVGATGAANEGRPIVADPNAEYTIDVNPNVPPNTTPQLGALRIVSSTGQNLRVPNIDAGGTATDGTLKDSTGATVTGIQGIGYTNSEPTPNTATQTLLYDINTTDDTLRLQQPPNNGDVSTTIGRLDLGVDVLSADFDIYPVLQGGRAFANVGIGVFTSSAGQILARVDVTSGLAISQGPVPNPISDIAVLYPQSYKG